MIYDAFFQGDAFLTLILGGIKRAEERFRDGLQTVDENGNPIDENGLRSLQGGKEGGAE